MKTVEERIKDLKKLAMIYLFLGIVWAVFLIVAEKTGWVNFRGDERDRYYLGLDGVDESFSQCSLNKMDFKLPYKVFNFLSVKDGVLTELISCDAGKEIDLRAFHPIYEVVDDNFIVFRDRIKNKSYLMEKDGRIIYEGANSIDASLYEEYGLFSLDDRAFINKEGKEILDEWYNNIVFWNGKLIVEKEKESDTYYGVFDLSGNCIIDPVYVEENHSSDWMYLKDSDGNYRLFDSEFNDVIEGGCKNLRYVSCNKNVSLNDYFIVQDNDGKWFTCDDKGNVYISERYDKLVSGKDEIDKAGILIAEKNGKKGIVNALNGEELLDVNYKFIQVYRINGDLSNPNYIFRVTTSDDKVGIVSLDNEVIVEPNYKDVSFFCAIRGKDNKPQDCLFKVTTMDNMVGMVTMNKGISVEPAYKDIDIAFNQSKEQKNRSYIKYAYILTTMDDKIGIYTEEDGFFAEPTDLINEEGEYYYFDERDVVGFKPKAGTTNVIIPKGKKPFTVEGTGMVFYKEYIEVHVSYSRDELITYDGEKYNG